MPKIKGLQICDFLRCTACEGSLDCPMIHAYARIYGTEEHPEARQNLDIFFPRTQQGKLNLGKQRAEDFSEAVGRAHDSAIKNYGKIRAQEETRKARYSRKPPWLR